MVRNRREQEERRLATAQRREVWHQLQQDGWLIATGSPMPSEPPEPVSEPLPAPRETQHLRVEPASVLKASKVRRLRIKSAVAQALDIVGRQTARYRSKSAPAPEGRGSNDR